MKSTFSVSFKSLCLLSISIAASNAAIAQDSGSNRTIEEIVVTTERREQSLQEVPLSITAFDDTKRDTVGILSIQDMANFAPGVSFTMSNDRPAIRGIGRESNFYSLDSPVANYVDGVYTSTVQDAQRRPIFIERTEILRGPQGALSGRGSIAGAINTISKRPSDDYSSEIRAYTRDYGQYGVEGTVTGPLADWLRARLNLATYHQDDGFFENSSTGHFEGDQPNNRDIADLHLDMNFGENIELYTKIAWVDYYETRRTTASTAPYTAGVQGSPTAYGPDSSELTPLNTWGYFPGSNGITVGNDTENPVITTGDLRQFNSDIKSHQRLTDGYENFTSQFSWHFPAASFQWIAGYQKYHYADYEDLDGTDVISMTLPTGRVVAPGGTDEYSEDRKWFSNEFTLTSTNDSDLQWIVGLFESRENTFQQPATRSFEGYDELGAPALSLDALLVNLGLQPFDPNTYRVNEVGQPPQIPTNPGNRTVYSIIDVDTISRAVFGQVDYQFNDDWKFTLGLRYNKDTKEVTESERLVANGLGDGLGDLLAGGFAGFVPTLAGLGLSGPIAVDLTPAYDGSPLPRGVVRDYGIDPVTGYRVRDLEADWDALTGSIGLDFTPNDDTLIFIRSAVGYRPGGFNAGFINDNPQVDEETVYSFEVGYKATLFDQLQLASSVFYYDFRDNQQPLPTLGRCTDQNDLSSCTTLNSFVNIPKSKSIGLEVELTYSPTDELNFYFTYGYLDATIQDGNQNGIGYSNEDDPAALLSNANPLNGLFEPLGPGDIQDPTDPPGLKKSLDDVTGEQRFTQDISGNRLRRAPKHRFALNTSYNLDFNPGSLTLSASYIWRDEQYNDLFENEFAKVDSFSTLGVRALWHDASDRYSIIFAVENLTDEEAGDGGGVTRQRTGLSGAAGAAYYQNINLSPPRVWSAEFQYRFGS